MGTQVQKKKQHLLRHTEKEKGQPDPSQPELKAGLNETPKKGAQVLGATEIFIRGLKTEGKARKPLYFRLPRGRKHKENVELWGEGKRGRSAYTYSGNLLCGRWLSESEGRAYASLGQALTKHSSGM